MVTTLEGTQVGAYRILRKIGEGGMGAVWMAEHAMLGRRAAVKVLHREFSNREDIVQRFFNEARAATAISDPGIVQIFDFGQHVDGSAYIVMELLEGETLHNRLARVGRLAPHDALRIMRQVASSLGAAHARGIVHRDLKPENIFLVRDAEVVGGERAKLLDFGIAKLMGDQAIKTRTSAIMGTPTYMSPEQCRGAGQVDQRSDVYALGCVLFALVTGQPPFVAEGVGDIMVMQLTQPAPAPSSRAPGIPLEVDGLVARCLAKNPNDRFSSAGELAAAIGAFVGSPTPVGLAPAIVPTLPPPAPGIQTTLSTAAGAAPSAPIAKRRSRALVIAVPAAVVAIGGIATVVAVTGGSPDDTGARGSSVVDMQPAAPTQAPHAPPAEEPEAAKPEPPKQADPRAELCAVVKDVFTKFVAWSHDHAGAPCPTIDALGATANDPWGRALVLTCTLQPKLQIIGAISAGPDGKLGTKDDIASWQLGNDVTDIVAGEHWTAAQKPAAKPVDAKPVAAKPDAKKVEPKNVEAKKQPDTRAGQPSAPAKPPTNQPIQLDENGLPVKR